MKIAIMITLCAMLCVCLSGCLFETEEERLARIESYNKQVAEYNAMIESRKNETTDSNTETTSKVEDKKPNTNSTPAKKESTMVTQFKKLGFTDAEAKEMGKIFTTVGITEINNIQAVGNNGIDKLQAFKCDIYDSRADKGGVSIHFTIDKRQLCFISLDGIATTKVDYAYINIFGNVKFKTSNGKKSVTLYDKWDENGEIDNDSIGYKAVLDYKNKKITNYK